LGSSRTRVRLTLGDGDGSGDVGVEAFGDTGCAPGFFSRNFVLLTHLHALEGGSHEGGRSGTVFVFLDGGSGDVLHLIFCLVVVPLCHDIRYKYIKTIFSQILKLTSFPYFILPVEARPPLFLGGFLFKKADGCDSCKNVVITILTF
jgi:hypothetical protein